MNSKLQVSPYNKLLLLADIVAGLSVASILLPEAVAYAAIAHLTIQHAITAVLVGLICYACLGGSQFAIVSPTSSAVALMAAVVVSLHPIDDNAGENLSFALVILTGVGLLAVAKTGLGRLSAFVSRPVLHGFSFALAATIIIKQLPILFGIQVHQPDPFRIVLALFHDRHDWSLWSAAMGCFALVLLRILKQWPVVPGAFVVLVLGIGLSSAVSLAEFQVAIVGSVQVRSPELNLPQLPLEKWLQLMELACGLLVIIVAESWGSIRSLALVHGNAVEPNRELFALGTANLVSGLFQGMPVGAGFSVSTANEQAGAQSKWSGVIAAILMLMTVIFGRNLIGLIPEPIVAAAVINALSHALSPEALVRLWRMDRDQYLAMAAIMAVLAFGVLHGMLISVGLSLVSAIRAFSQPLVRELAELGDTRDFVDYQNHPDAATIPHLLILRPEEPLFFASVEGILAEIQQRIESRSTVKIVIISLEESGNLDSTAAESLIEFATSLQRQGVILLLARVKDPIRLLLLKFANEQFEDKLFWSVADAVASAQTVTRLEIPCRQGYARMR